MVAMARHAAQEIAEALENMADSRDLELARTYRRFRASQRPVLVMNSGTVMTDLPALARVDAEFYADLWERLRHHSWDQSEFRFEVPMLGSDVMVQPLRPRRSGRDLRAGVPGADRNVVRRGHGRPQSSGARCPLCTACRTAQPPAGPALPRTTMSNGSSPLRPPSMGSFALSAAPGAASATRLRNGCGSARVRSPRSSLRVTFRRMTASGATEKPHCATDGGVIVVGGEKLSSESRERLDDFARLPRPDVAAGCPGHPHRTHPDGQPRVRGRRRAGFGTRALPRRPAWRAARRRARGRMPSFSLTRRHRASRRLRCNACWPGRGRATWQS